MNKYVWPTWMGEVPRANAPWNQQEDTRLSNEFRDGTLLSDLAHDHGRTLGGIKSRLRALFDDRTLEMVQRERLVNRGIYVGTADLFQLFDIETLTPQEYSARYGIHRPLATKRRDEIVNELSMLRKRISELELLLKFGV